jgi:hypothetical protein
VETFVNHFTRLKSDSTMPASSDSRTVTKTRIPGSSRAVTPSAAAIPVWLLVNREQRGWLPYVPALARDFPSAAGLVARV